MEPAGHTCNLRSLREALEVSLATGVYAAAQTQDTATMYAYRMQVVGQVCWESLATAEGFACVDLVTAGSAPTAAEGKTHIGFDHTAAEACDFVRMLEALRRNAQSVGLDEANVQQVAAEAGRILCS